MLKSTKEHWKKKAEEEYYAATTEKEKMDQEKMNQYDWNRRYREGKWLLKGAKKVEDKQLVSLIDEKVENDKRGRYIPEEDLKKKKKVEAETEGLSVMTAQRTKIDYVQKLRNYIIPRKKKKQQGRIRNARFVIKEGIAKLFVDRDAHNERDRFLQENSKRIRVLQNIRLDLYKSRLPAHHESMDAMPDAEPQMSAEVAAEISAMNLGYREPPRQRIIENLRSVEDVKNEEIERRLHTVSGRFHQFLGLHRIFPLRFAPRTHDVIYSEHAVKENYPEDKLLPDYAAIEREKQEELKLRRWEANPIKKIKKSKLDMSRKQFHFANNVVVPTNDADSNVHINTQFEWKRRQIEERNSVYSQAHGSVQFSDGGKSAIYDSARDGSSLRDDSTTDTSVKYYLDGDQSVSLVPALTAGMTVAASLSSYGDMATELCYSDEFASDNALRSNFLSTGSTGSNRLIRVKMERHRKLKNLMGKHVKGLSLESIRTQQKRRDIQQIRKFANKAHSESA